MLIFLFFESFPTFHSLQYLYQPNPSTSSSQRELPQNMRMDLFQMELGYGSFRISLFHQQEFDFCGRYQRR